MIAVGELQGILRALAVVLPGAVVSDEPLCGDVLVHAVTSL
jgi:hypothetical protein